MPQKVALFITGVPGTGKTQQMTNIIDLFVVKDPFIIQMDRHRLPGMQGPTRYRKTDVMLNNAVASDKNVVYENMAMSKWVRDNVVTRLHACGYKIIFVLLWTNPHQALMQRIRRRERTRRWVSPRYVQILEDRTPREFFDTCRCLGTSDQAILLYNTPGKERVLDKVVTMTANEPPLYNANWTVNEYLKLAQLPPTAREEAIRVLLPGEMRREFAN